MCCVSGGWLTVGFDGRVMCDCGLVMQRRRVSVCKVSAGSVPMVIVVGMVCGSEGCIWW